MNMREIIRTEREHSIEKAMAQNMTVDNIKKTIGSGYRSLGLRQMFVVGKINTNKIGSGGSITVTD